MLLWMAIARTLGQKHLRYLVIALLLMALLIPDAVSTAAQRQDIGADSADGNVTRPAGALLSPGTTSPMSDIQRIGTSISRFGPSRTTPDAGLPKHAYSPFDELPSEPQPLVSGRDFAPGQVLIKIQPTTQVAKPQMQGALTSGLSLNALLSAQGVSGLEPVFPTAQQPRPKTAAVEGGTPQPVPDLTRWYRASLPAAADVLAVAQALAAHPDVAAAEPDYLRRLAALPGPSTDPRYSEQWHLAAIRAPEAWQFLDSQGINPGGSRDVVVAVIDTGVDYNHPDLAGNIWTNGGEIPGNGVDDDRNGFVDDVHGVNVISNLRTGDPMDDHGHGTHVAGIIAAQGNNGLGVVGVAYNVQIMPIKAAQYSGVLSTTDIAEAIYYAVEKGADVINMSYGGYGKSQIEEDALVVAFGQAVLVAAAGNDGIPNEKPFPEYPGLAKPMYPAAYNWVLGVMASIQGGAGASFSNWDPIPQNPIEYEIMVPGVDILSTLPGNQYAAWDGTSMAAPVVSGIAALARSYFRAKEVYSSRFIMGQIATAGADAYEALAKLPQPKLSYLEHWLFDTANQSTVDDNDGIVDAGETIDLAVVIRNHWGKADNVTVNLSARAPGAVLDDPFVSFVTNNISYGAIGSFNWDDNGLIYDAQGVTTGVLSPFRFTVSANCTNDHIIPFLVTMTARNGLDPTDNTTYSFQSRFNLGVTRGRELPRIISQNMTLTKNDFWIVPGQTLIESGVTVNITEGTQVQWGAPKPSDPYSNPTTPMFVVKGSLLITGTYDEPVELFPSPILGGYTTIQNWGTTNITYAKIRDPQMGDVRAYRGLVITAVDHSYVEGNSAEYRVLSTTNTILRKLKGSYGGFGTMDPPGIRHSLIDNNIQWPNISPGSAFDWRVHPQLWAEDTAILSSDGVKLARGSGNGMVRNAFLNNYWNYDISKWIRFMPAAFGSGSFDLGNNYWGTNITALIDAAVYDYNDDFNLPLLAYTPILTSPAETTYPFVWKMGISQGSQSTTRVGPGQVTFNITFNRDMDTSVQPAVSFGPDTPVTDYTIYPIGGGWQSPRTWVGTRNINTMTGDGYQLMRIAGPARAASDPWLVIGDDAGRFRFEIITSGTEAMNLQATGVESAVELGWTQDDFDLLAGYTLYRSTSATGSYTRLNSTVIPADQKSYRDTNVQPGQTYYYKFTVVKTDMTESSFSNVAAGTPIDTIAPVISHSPVSKAAVGLPLQIYADVSDNVRVASVTLYHRAMGTTTYDTRPMVKTTGNRYSATLEGSLVAAPGLEYYLEASDGVSIVRQGRADSPYRVAVTDTPEVTAVSPNRGPASGGTAVTVSGSNFKAGASVTFGGAVASGVTLVSSNQLTAVTPAHFPAVVDVAVINPGGGSGNLLRAFTYESDIVPVSLPDASGDSGAIVEVPITLTDVRGLLSASVTVQFDSNVLTARGGRKGALSPGFSLETNTGTPGQVRVSLASATSVSGSGVLAYLEFLVNGAPSTSSNLTFLSVSLNDGAIPVSLDHGTFSVKDLLDVSGQVRYYQGSRPVPGASLSLDGTQSFSGTTDQSGSYALSGIPSGSYTLTPSKSGDTEAITAYDASLILRASAGLITLSGHQQVAGDVDKSGGVTAMDASYVLQRSAGLIELPFPGSGRVWDFAPSNRSYQPLSADLSGQDFTAILIGDVSGNWGQAGAQGVTARPRAETMGTAELVLSRMWVRPSTRIVVSLDLALSQADLYGADIVLTYDPAVASAVSVATTDLANDFSMAVNMNQPGQIRIAMAGATPITVGGKLLSLTFDIGGDYGTVSPLEITAAQLNEGGIPMNPHSGRLTVAIMGDADFSGAVDVADLVTVASSFNLPMSPGREQADVNGDGVINIFDLALVGLNFGHRL